MTKKIAKTTLAEQADHDQPGQPGQLPQEAVAKPAWSLCPGCHKDRRLANDVLVQHRAWHPARLEMLDCLGAGHAPLSVAS